MIPMHLLLVGLLSASLGSPGGVRKAAPAAVVPLRTLDPKDPDDSDLAFLDAGLSGVQVVQLGESSHCTAEFSSAKVRLIRYLHERLGFDVVAFESPMLGCFDASAASASADPDRLAGTSLFSLWGTREVAELFRYMKATRATAHPLLLAGFDIQTSAYEAHHRAAFWANLIQPLDPVWSERARTLEDRYQAALQAISGERNAWPWRQALFAAQGKELMAGYGALEDFLRSNSKELAEKCGRTRVALAIRMALCTQRELERMSGDWASSFEGRDRAMADNVAWLRNEMFPGAKLILWAHNVHIQYAPGNMPGAEGAIPMGQWLRYNMGPELYAIGLFMRRGEVGYADRTSRPVSPIRPGSVEARLAAPRKPAVFVNLRRLQKGSWVDRPTTAKYWGGLDRPCVPREYFDGILCIDEIHPPNYLQAYPSQSLDPCRNNPKRE